MIEAPNLPAGGESLSADLLDQVEAELREGSPQRAMADLFEGLQGLRNAAPTPAWNEFASKAAIEHPVRRLIHADPMTCRSFEKPRGYAGDAVLLDFIYGITRPEPGEGTAVYDYAVGRAAACAVRHRRAVIAHAIDRVVDQPGPSRVMSIACGHLREAELSGAMRSGWIDRFVALDSDADSLQVVSERWGGSVECSNQSVARLMGKPERFGEFELVYSAGLYDYLELDVARRLTKAMFDMTAPGGRVLLSNFHPGVPDAGYMETFMGWKLIYRSATQLESVADDIPRDRIESMRTFVDPFGAITYLEIERARS